MDRAETIMEKFSLSWNAKVKLRQIVEKRAGDVNDVLDHIEQVLQIAYNPSAQLSHMAEKLIQGGRLTAIEMKMLEKEARQAKKLLEKKAKLMAKSSSNSSSSEDSDSTSSVSDSAEKLKKRAKKKGIKTKEKKDHKQKKKKKKKGKKDTKYKGRKVKKKEKA